VPDQLEAFRNTFLYYPEFDLWFAENPPCPVQIAIGHTRYIYGTTTSWPFASDGNRNRQMPHATSAVLLNSLVHSYHIPYTDRDDDGDEFDDFDIVDVGQYVDIPTAWQRAGKSSPCPYPTRTVSDGANPRPPLVSCPMEVFEVVANYFAASLADLTNRVAVDGAGFVREGDEIAIAREWDDIREGDSPVPASPEERIRLFGRRAADYWGLCFCYPDPAEPGGYLNV
jgi:hypothetical protein